MTAVSQRIPNFLGGVSQQADEKLFPGQVKDALNCYPDTTHGMIKRSGGRFLSKLSNIATAQSLDTDAWFTVLSDATTKYVVCVQKSNGIVRVWDLTDGTEKTVTDTAGTRTYLTATDYRNLKWLTINDFTYLLNTEVTITAQAAPSFTPRRQATIVVTVAEYDTLYKVRINGTDYNTYRTPDSITSNSNNPLELSQIMTGISNAITGGYTTKTIVDNTIHLTHTSDIDISVSAGPDGKYMRVFQDSIETFNRLPEQAVHNRVVKIANTTADKDDYYLRFVATNGTSGTGYWQETIAPDVSPGITYSTMPVALIRNANGTFTVTPLDGTTTVNNLALKWEDRLVGDSESNEHPSFVNNKIRDIFLYNNRLGFLTSDNISMSQAGDYYNFYHNTATTQVASDPIDLSCSSIRPAILNSVVPISQGLLLFSKSQQFLMESENGSWTPSDVSIRTISNYECDEYIKPADLGSTVMFASRNQSWVRAFEIFTRGQREAPTVSESSKIVPEWIPQTVNYAVGSAQNGLWVASSRSLNDLYMFRYYDEGDERKMASWVRWKLYSNIIHTAIQEDVLYIITSGTEGYNILSHKLVQSPSTGGLINSLGNTVDPYLDAWFEITTTPTFASGVTKVYLPSHVNTAKQMQYVVGLLKVNPTNLNYSGLTNTIAVLSDGGGNYFEIPGDVTGNYIYIGYQYQMEVLLPRYNYSAGDQGYDFTGYTTTARMKFYTGLGGSVNFNLKDNTRLEWTDISGVQVGDIYPADTSPFRDSFIYKVPVYQRPDNYKMKVLSNNPFPVSLVAMQWEGQYSPGFYRRS